jgi:hypothetical protein
LLAWIARDFAVTRPSSLAIVAALTNIEAWARMLADRIGRGAWAACDFESDGGAALID